MLARCALFILSMVFIALPMAGRAQSSGPHGEIDLDFSTVTGLAGGPTTYLDGVKEIPWVLRLIDECRLDEQRLTKSAKSKFIQTKLGFVSPEEAIRDSANFLDRPTFRITITALPASSGCAASISASVVAPVEGARFVYDKKPLSNYTYVTIWNNKYKEGGRVIYESHEQIMPRIEATIDTLINEFAEAWTHSQGIGHPKWHHK